jgi:DNA-binding beta-propeller fold protein YncE
MKKLKEVESTMLHRNIWLTSHRLLTSLFLLFAAAPEIHAAKFQRGDIFSTGFINNANQLVQYRADGTIVQSFLPTGGGFLGATITVDGKLITTHRFPTSGINIFDANGNEVRFPTPTVSITGDVSVFADGTLAISDQDDRVELYSQTGVYLGAIWHPSLGRLVSSPFGSAIGPDDTLWVALFNRGAARFSRDGAFLGSFNPGFSVQELAVDPVDGTIWIASPTATVHQFTADGAELRSFMSAAIPPFLRGIAVAADQTVYVTSDSSDRIYHYSPNGVLLDSIALAGGPLFISVLTVPESSSGSLLLTSLLFALIQRTSYFKRTCVVRARG